MSRGGHGAKFFVRFAVGLLVVLLGCELAVRAASGRLPEPRHYFSPLAQGAVHDMDALAARHIRSDAVFVGTSMMRRDVDVNQLESTSKRANAVRLPSVQWAHNLALPAAQTTVIRPWLLEEVIPRLHPKRIVWGVSTLDFNDGRPDHPIVQYENSRASKHGFYADVDRLLWHSAVSDHRDTLRDPYKLVQSLGSSHPVRFGTAKPLAKKATYDLTAKPMGPARLAKMRAEHLQTVSGRQLRHFRVGPKEWAAFVETIRDLRAMHIEVVVVVMPVPQGYVDAHPGGPQQYFAWKDRVTAAAKQLDVPLFDMWNSFGPDTDWQYFRDYEHLSPPAGHEFTNRLATKLRELGW